MPPQEKRPTSSLFPCSTWQHVQKGHTRGVGGSHAANALDGVDVLRLDVDAVHLHRAMGVGGWVGAQCGRHRRAKGTNGGRWNECVTEGIDVWHLVAAPSACGYIAVVGEPMVCALHGIPREALVSHSLVEVETWTFKLGTWNLNSECET
jgi:hypothetical protein